MRLVADTSALVSLASTTESRQDALPLLLDGYDVTIPEQVLDELEEIAAYDDEDGTAARTLLDARTRLTIRAVDLDPDLPLDDGENAAVQLANQLEASFFYCDEYTQLALIHASLSDAQLVTTPRLLKAFVVHGTLSKTTTKSLLDAIAARRSWDGNAYVHQATRLFD
jgi:predicted nucleic acid-binding protein